MYLYRLKKINNFIMKKITYLFFLFFYILPLMPLLAQPEVTPAIQTAVAERGEEAFISVNLRLDAQVDDQLLYHQSRTISNPDKRRSFVINELKQFSKQTQAELLDWLRIKEAEGKVRNIRPLWIANLINCEAKPEVIQELMTRKDLARVDYNKERQVLMANPEQPSVPVIEPDNIVSPNLAWNVTLVNADQAWAEGYTGEGVIVAVLDTGINYNHLDITDNMWEHPDYPNHGFNFVNNNHVTMDYQSHGTHCAGTVAGTGAAGTGTGIAPGATIMNLKVLGDTGSGTEAGVWTAIQFAVDYGAHVMSLSLGWQHQWNPDRSTWRITMNNALSAGLIASVASGNEGGWGGQPPPSEVRTPGDVPPPWLNPDQTLQGGVSAVVSVGSTTSADVLSGFSSKGPVTWQNVAPFNDYHYSPGMGLIRPDIVAPGSDILSLVHNTNTGYTTKSGTSMAAPAVAGAIALILSKNPGLTPEQVSQILEESAEPQTTSKSNSYGSGRLDAFAAISQTPYMGIRYVAHELDDSQGNDDGNINPDEFIKINLTLENPTEEMIEGVMASVAVESPFITLIDSVATVGDIDAETEIDIEAIFTFQVADNIPGNYPVEFVITTYASTDPDETWTSSFIEYAHAPQLLFSDLIIDDTQNGDGDGILDPGETADVIITLSNEGQMESGEIEAWLVSDSPWITILSHEVQELAPLAPEASVDVVFQVMASMNTPLESPGELIFKAFSDPFEFESVKEIIIGEAPYYDLGDIPSTYNTNVTTASSALDPGQMTVTIPEGATITGVDIEYKMTSHGGAWMSEQRSFMRCVSPGGTTESQVYSGTSNSGGTIDYERTGLDIANNVTGGGDIEFELHAFRTWGGSGSSTQYVYVPNNTWKIIVYYELPKHDVTFRVSNQFEEMVEGAIVEVSNEEHQTDVDGEAHTEMPAGVFYYTATADSHRPHILEPFEVIEGEENIIDIMLTRVFEVTFEIMDVHGNDVPNPVITVDGEVIEAGQYTIDDLDDGLYPFAVEAEGHQTYEGEFEIIDTDLYLPVQMSPYYVLSFDVKDEFGAEVHDAIITIEGDSYAQGEYVMADYIPGTYQFVVSADHYHDYNSSFEVYDDDVLISVVLEADGTNISEIDHVAISVYPNPARDLVSVSIPSDGLAEITVTLINAAGQTIKTVMPAIDEASVEVDFDVSDLTPGIYFIRINNGQTSTHQLIVQ